MGTILIDNNEANKSIDNTDKKATGLAGKLGGALKTGAKVTAGAVAAMGTAAAGAGATLYKFATDSAATADNIDKMSQKIGMSKQAYQEFDFICSQSGMSVDQLKGGFKTLTTQMDSAIKGGDKATNAFAKLGVTVEDVKNLSREDLFKKTIAGLQKLDNETERATLANQLFGKAGSEMMPLLNSGAGSIEEMTQKAHDLGLVMSDEAIGAGVKFTDTMDQLKRSFSMIGTEIGVSVMPIIQKLGEWLVEEVPKIKEFVGPIFEGIKSFFELTVGKISEIGLKLNEILGPSLEKIGTWFKGEGLDSSKLFSDAFDMIGKVIEIVATIISVFIDILDKYIFKNEDVMNTIKTVWNTVKDVFNTTIEIIETIVNSFIETFEKVWNKWGDEITIAINTVWGGIQVVIETTFNAINTAFNIFKALFKGDWDTAWNEIKNLVSGIWDGIKKYIDNSLDGIINIFTNIKNRMKEKGKEIFNSVWDGIKEVWNSISSWVGEKVEWLADKLAFWKKSEKDMSNGSGNSSSNVDGSHANGLSYVPWDGYIAELHEGERVLTKAENKGYSGYGSNQVTFNIYNPYVRNDNDLKEMEKMIKKIITKNNRGLGLGAI